ncbi:MAG: hypothetical protein V4617_06675 [Gemmatimonadota bacterium]
MARLLVFAERRVDLEARPAYLADVRARQATAAASGAHFWVFEHAGESGRFVEFTEGGSEEAVRLVAGTSGDDHAPLALWREVQGG